MIDAVGLIYIIEPDSAVRNSFRFALEAEGHTVEELPDGASFLTRSDYPSRSCLVLADKLADMSGVDLLQTLRERSLIIPAILVASLPTHALIRRIDRLGVLLIEKPILDGSLIDAVSRAIGVNQV